MNPIIEQQADRYDALVKGLEDAHTPPECNGFAVIMKDSVICLLQGSKLQMLHSTGFGASAFGAVFTVCISVVGVVAMIVFH